MLKEGPRKRVSLAGVLLAVAVAAFFCNPSPYGGYMLAMRQSWSFRQSQTLAQGNLAGVFGVLCLPANRLYSRPSMTDAINPKSSRFQKARAEQEADRLFRQNHRNDRNRKESTIIIKDVNGLKDAIEVRRAVFVQEQGIVNAFDHLDMNMSGEPVLHRNVVHVVAYLDEEEQGRLRRKAVATGRLLIQQEKGVKQGIVSNVAVLKEHRKQGYAKSVMESLHREAQEFGVRAISLHSQAHAIGFYQGMGYRTQTMHYREPFDGPNGILAFMVKDCSDEK